MDALFCYPGSTAKHAHILKAVRKMAPKLRTEPFAGTASVSLALLPERRVGGVHLNDIDAGLIDLWRRVRDDAQLLVKDVQAYSPSTEDFYRWKQLPQPDGFQTLVLHQISYDGLGRMAASPMGGKCQQSPYKVGCRSSPGRLARKVHPCHELLNSVPCRITWGSWKDCDLDGGYLGPPYLDQGPALYYSETIAHVALATRLRDTKNLVLSYDDVPEARQAGAASGRQS